ncbi:hypothetical protein QWY28_00725 [Nocardioides sp. SOB77]|uniref:Uncharacterized protein n=1 Tax=Nocardioides oceani TaxID=3058369 RepID=A0ABT8F9Y3_9ACTN|nr:hypothetical protein [Nocardioides oceani]MDN4171458.1 hypothetical protein [Nocardioides oceani]
MSDEQTPTPDRTHGAAPDQPPADPPADLPADPPAARRSRAAALRARLRGARGRSLGWRGVAAVALASLLIGGAGGALVHAVADDHGHHGHHGDRGRPDFSTVRPEGFGDDADRGQPGRPGLPPQTVPEGTAPQEDVQPDPSGDTSSSDAT